jgi:two-component system chemotaxis response regulator CheY
MAFKVLIVDDSLPMRAIIKKVVKVSGFNVGEFFEASSGDEALDILKDQWLDLVLTDYNMPHMDGLELLDRMKKDELLQSIPVIMITTESGRERVKEFMEKGAADYIRKPFTPEEIREKLNRVLGEVEYGEGSPDNGDEELDF